MRDLAACPAGYLFGDKYRDTHAAQEWWGARCWLTRADGMRCQEEVSPDDPIGMCDKHRSELGLNKETHPVGRPCPDLRH